MTQLPDHPMFDYSRDVLALRALRDKDWARKPWVALLASQAWHDPMEIENWIDALAAKYGEMTLIHAGQNGPMRGAVARAEGQGFKLIEVESRAEWGSARQAVQATHICQLADIITCFWAGTSDLVETVIKKALLVHRPDFRFDPGLHVYEMKKSRATKSKKSTFTGRTRYRHRKGFELAELQEMKRAA